VIDVIWGSRFGLHEAVTLGDALSVALRESREDELEEWVASDRAEALRVVALTHRLTRLATAPPVVRPLRNVALRLLAFVRHSGEASPSSSLRSAPLRQTG
jgi:hypothetical protein